MPFDPTLDNKTRIGRWAVIVACVAVAPFFWRWLSDNGDNVAPTPDASGPILSAQGAQYVRSFDNGRKVWEFAAARIEISADKRFATATDVSRGVWYRDDKPYLQLRATRVRFNQETRDWQAEGDFSIQGPDGFSLRAKRATWSESTQSLSCPGEVNASLRGAQLRTSQVVYEATRNQLRSQKDVAVDSKAATLRGAPVQVDTKNRKIEWQGGVKIIIRREAVERVIGRVP